MNEFLKLVYCSIACGAISMTTAKSKIFQPLRDWITAKSPWLGEGVSCPYCTSHWVSLALMLVYHPRPLTCDVAIIDYFVATMMMVALSSVSSWVIFQAYAAMVTPDYQALKAALEYKSRR